MYLNGIMYYTRYPALLFVFLASDKQYKYHFIVKCIQMQIPKEILKISHTFTELFYTHQCWYPQSVMPELSLIQQWWLSAGDQDSCYIYRKKGRKKKEVTQMKNNEGTINM